MTDETQAQETKRPEVELEELLGEARELENAGKADEARRLLADVPEVMQRFGSYHYARGALAFRAGDLDEAIAAFTKAVGEEPRIAEYYGNLGAALLERSRQGSGTSDLQRAAMTLERAADLGPKLPAPYVNHGLALQLLGRNEDALEALAKALALDADDTSALYNTAATCHALGREDKCLEALDRLLAVDGAFVPALRSRCATLARLGRKAEAEAALDVYLAASPEAADKDELRALIG